MITQCVIIFCVTVLPVRDGSSGLIRYDKKDSTRLSIKALVNTLQDRRTEHFIPRNKNKVDMM